MAIPISQCFLISSPDLLESHGIADSCNLHHLFGSGRFCPSGFLALGVFQGKPSGNQASWAKIHSAQGERDSKDYLLAFCLNQSDDGRSVPFFGHHSEDLVWQFKAWFDGWCKQWSLLVPEHFSLVSWRHPPDKTDVNSYFPYWRTLVFNLF